MAPARHHGLHAEEKNGPTPRNFAADAHDCIMVWDRDDPTEYKAVTGLSRHLEGKFPSDRSGSRLSVRGPSLPDSWPSISDGLRTDTNRRGFQ